MLLIRNSLSKRDYFSIYNKKLNNVSIIYCILLYKSKCFKHNLFNKKLILMQYNIKILLNLFLLSQFLIFVLKHINHINQFY